MQLSDLSEAVDYQHVYLSPHLDDAALSAGGTIAVQRAAGERVLVVTLCTAVPPSDPSRRWPAALAPERVEERRDEDRQAMARLDVDFAWAELLDALYRVPSYGLQGIFGPAHPRDPALAEVRGVVERLAAQCPGATLHAPLGVGSHVDHRAAFSAALEQRERFRERRFYEDFPYVANERDALATRRAAIGLELAPVDTAIDDFVTEKLDAIACYESQLPLLFGGVEAMRALVLRYVASLGPGCRERAFRLT